MEIYPQKVGGMNTMSLQLLGLDYEEFRLREAEEELMRKMYTDRVPLTFGQRNSPTMAADFARKSPHKLLLGNEAGDIVLVDCQKQRVDSSLPSSDLQSYPDAIFDVTWKADDSNYALAVGDMHVYVHDSENMTVQQCLGYHDSSVRTVRYRPNHPDILGTAGRDGCIALWDLRTADRNSNKNRPINVIEDAHASFSGHLGKKETSNSSSVTAFEFMPINDHLIYSIGQPDYAVRTWDTRYTRKRGQLPRPVSETALVNTGRRQRAFISLCTDSTGSRLYAVSSDNHIYNYLTSNLELMNVFSAPEFRTSGSFYIRSTISPCDRFLLCGCTEGSAVIWSITGPQYRNRAFKLYEHRYEVSCVSWSRDGMIFAGGEDYVSRLWYNDGDSFEIDPVRHVRLEPLESPELNISHKPTYRKFECTPPTTLNSSSGLDPWPIRAFHTFSTTTRLPFNNLSNHASAPSTPNRKRQAILDTFFTPNKMTRYGQENKK